MSKTQKINLIIFGIAATMLIGVFYNSGAQKADAQSAYYQGIIFGTPTTRTIKGYCAGSYIGEGCSSKPFFSCSPWVDSSGKFIDYPVTTVLDSTSGAYVDGPAGTIHINYQGNYSNAADAVTASKTSLKNCLKNTGKYGKYNNGSGWTGDPDYSYYLTSAQLNSYIGANSISSCALGNRGSLTGGSDYWYYKGGITSAYDSFYGYQCKYNGVYEEIKWDPNVNPDSIPYNKVYLSSSDCTPDKYGYTPRINECNGVSQTVLMAQQVIPQCTGGDASTCSAWSTCSGGSQTCTGTYTKTPLGCSGGTPTAPTQSCTPACTDYTYSSWGECSVDGTQTRVVQNTTPSPCSGGVEPVLTQSCTPSCVSADSSTCSSWGTCSGGIQTCTGTYSKLPAGCSGNVSAPVKSCAMQQAAANSYGVYVDENGYLLGYTWSDNIGWIKFGGLSGFPTGVGTLAQNAQMVNGKVVGWARACAATKNGDCSTMENGPDGWDGWISLGGNVALSAPSVIVSGLPDAPRNVIASIKNGEVHVWFWPPASNGESPITNYRIVSSPGNIVTDINNSYWDTMSYKTITGLTSRVPYKFTVTATNANGTSPASEPSNTLTLGLESNIPAVQKDWYVAVSTCSGLGSGWRLISYDELVALSYENAGMGAFWTSTEIPGDPNSVYQGGGREYSALYKSFPYDKIWCVK